MWARFLTLTSLLFLFASFSPQSEIFDMACPKVPGRITLDDLIASRCGHTVISILIDVNGFCNYEARESHTQTEEEN